MRSILKVIVQCYIEEINNEFNYFISFPIAKSGYGLNIFFSSWRCFILHLQMYNLKTITEWTILWTWWIRVTFETVFVCKKTSIRSQKTFEIAAYHRTRIHGSSSTCNRPILHILWDKGKASVLNHAFFFLYSLRQPIWYHIILFVTKLDLQITLLECTLFSFLFGHSDMILHIHSQFTSFLKTLPTFQSNPVDSWLMQPTFNLLQKPDNKRKYLSPLPGIYILWWGIPKLNPNNITITNKDNHNEVACVKNHLTKTFDLWSSHLQEIVWWALPCSQLYLTFLCVTH